MVVDLAIDGQNDALILVGKGLGTALYCGVSFLISENHTCGQQSQGANVPTPTILRRSWHNIVWLQVTLPPIATDEKILVKTTYKLATQAPAPGGSSSAYRAQVTQAKTYSNRDPDVGSCKMHR